MRPFRMVYSSALLLPRFVVAWCGYFLDLGLVWLSRAW